MKERPILFKSEMIRAILDGRKTQTRRIMNPQPSEWFKPSECERYNPAITDKDGYYEPGPEIFGCYDLNGEDEGYKCKWEPGTRLWVKETWRTRREWDSLAPSKLPMSEEDSITSMSMREGYITYAESDPQAIKLRGKLRPSIFMPRWASRITLEIAGVRVERLNDISEPDAIAEGVTIGTDAQIASHYIDGKAGPAQLEYWHLWESINGKGSWKKNPWVWVIEFREL